MIIVVVIAILIISGAFFYYFLFNKERDISELIVGEWIDNTGLKSVFNEDMTMVYLYSSDVEIKGQYEFTTGSVMVWTLQRVYAPNDKLIFKYTIKNKNEITLEDMYYNANKELVSYNNPILTLTRD